MKGKQPSKPEKVTVGHVSVKIYARQRTTATGGRRLIFEVSDRTSGIRRLRGFSDHTAARREAERIAQQLSSGDVEAASMRAGEAASYGRAIELLRPTGASLELAASVYAKAFEIAGGDLLIESVKFYKRHRADQVQQRPVAAVIVELLASKESRGSSSRHVGDLRARLTRFAVAFGANPSVISEPDKKDEDGNDARNRGVNISTINAPDVQRWLDGLKVGSQTTKNYRTTTHALFAHAQSRGYILKGSNPVADTEKISAKGGKIEIYSPREITKLLNAAPESFLPVIALGGFAGMRTAEIERIEWQNIDLASGFIHIGGDKAKTRTRRLVPILPNLAAWLAAYAKRSGKVWKGTPDDLRKARAKTVEATGLVWKDNGLRHSFASYRLAEIQNAAQVALELGNSAEVVFKHYRELVKPADAKAWFAVSPKTAVNVVPMAKEA